MPLYIVTALNGRVMLRENVFDAPLIDAGLATAKDVWRDLGDVSWLATHAEDNEHIAAQYAGQFRAIRSNATGVPFNVRLVRRGDRWGRNNCLTHDEDDPLVEFYDARADRKAFGPFGQFISNYYLSTLCKGATAYGLELRDGHQIDAEAMAPLLADLRKLESTSTR